MEAPPSAMEATYSNSQPPIQVSASLSRTADAPRRHAAAVEPARGTRCHCGAAADDAAADKHDAADAAPARRHTARQSALSYSCHEQAMTVAATSAQPPSLPQPAPLLQPQSQTVSQSQTAKEAEAGAAAASCSSSSAATAGAASSPAAAAVTDATLTAVRGRAARRMRVPSRGPLRRNVCHARSVARCRRLERSDAEPQQQLGASRLRAQPGSRAARATAESLFLFRSRSSRSSSNQIPAQHALRADRDGLRSRARKGSSGALRQPGGQSSRSWWRNQQQPAAPHPPPQQP